VPLVAQTDSTYLLDFPLTVARPNGRGQLVVQMEQGLNFLRLEHRIDVLPLADKEIFVGANPTNWTLNLNPYITPAADARVVYFEERVAHAYAGAPGGLRKWSMEFVAPTAVSPGGFKAIRLAFHPRDVERGGFLALYINETSSCTGAVLSACWGTVTILAWIFTSRIGRSWKFP